MPFSALLRCIGLAMVAGAASPAFASPFSAVYVFGDSGSDVGNTFIASGGLNPAPPYFAGHFSNGPTWVEDLAQTLGLGPLVPSLQTIGLGPPLPSIQGGVDYAFGGATTGPAVPGRAPGPPDVVQQVAHFSGLHAGVAPPTGLYAVDIGADDISQAITDILGGSLTVTEATADLAAAAQDAAGAVHTLALQGAKTFIVTLVYDVGKKPFYIGSNTTALATQFTLSYNADLLADIDALILSDGISVHFVDNFALTDAEVNDPAGFDFTDVTDPCYVGRQTGGGTVCADPNSFLWWDQTHLTEHGNQVLAALALDAIPEPEMMPGFVAGGLLLILLRGRKRNR
ncbi:MAG: SGNH/GDSL hydrolase family protein [Acetobacteraceae bacterium]|nr:SGNH/GDSL hydrolase family protein [Acetobacteraceae bacterium]